MVEARSQGGIEPLVEPGSTPCPAHFMVKIPNAPLWFEVELPKDYPLKTSQPLITVRGHDISRAVQQRWQDVVRETSAQLNQTDFPTYELVSLHLLPLLHAEYDPPAITMTTVQEASVPEIPYHTLLTSHHLKSPQKRRSLQQWSAELRLSGFAKVGHPGVIYCSGSQANVEEFAFRVKAMQWLALRVRFVEPLPSVDDVRVSVGGRGRGYWLEIEKVGDVVEEMKKLGRERYVLDLGIGGGGK